MLNVEFNDSLSHRSKATTSKILTLACFRPMTVADIRGGGGGRIAKRDRTWNRVESTLVEDFHRGFTSPRKPAPLDTLKLFCKA